jgi:alpha-L-fucosidase 2
MLLQSHTGEISILPALPMAWPEGEVKGLRARRDVEVDIAWTGGRATRVALRSPVGGPRQVRLQGGKVLTVRISANRTTVLSGGGLDPRQ